MPPASAAKGDMYVGLALFLIARQQQQQQIPYARKGVRKSRIQPDESAQQAIQKADEALYASRQKRQVHAAQP